MRLVVDDSQKRESTTPTCIIDFTTVSAICSFGKCSKENYCFCNDFKRFINFANAVKLVQLDSQATVPFIPFRQTSPEIRSPRLLRKRESYVHQFQTQKKPAGENTNKQTNKTKAGALDSPSSMQCSQITKMMSLNDRTGQINEIGNKKKKNKL